MKTMFGWSEEETKAWHQRFEDNVADYFLKQIEQACMKKRVAKAVKAYSKAKK